MYLFRTLQLNLQLFVFIFLFFGCNTHQNEKNDHKEQIKSNNFIQKKDSLKTVQQDTVLSIQFDSTFDQISSYIAGINTPKDSLPSKDSIWNIYAKQMDQSWKIADNRYAKLKIWSDSEKIALHSSGKVLFYPFSGPDFLNANILFPNCDRYILAGLEPVGMLPTFKGKPDTSNYNYLMRVNNSLKDILHSSFFHTKRMKVQFTEQNVNGALPILCIFIKRQGFVITNIEAVRITNDGEATVFPYDSLTKDSFEAKSVKVSLMHPETKKKKEVFFFSHDLSNGGFSESSPLYKFVASQNGFFTFMKSASYLMHYDYFKNIRELVINNTSGLMQDDTGIPYRYLDSTTWNVKLYGGYAIPVKTFKKSMFTQKDLKNKYKKDSLNIEKLPFSLGYQSKPQNTSIIFGLKK